MSDQSNAAVAEPPTINPAVKPAQKERPTPQQNKPKRKPPYAVILHNDDLNSMQHVIAVLRKVLNVNVIQAIKLMMQAHRTGRAIVWSGVLEVAELKADQIRSCGPDPIMKAHGAGPLRVTIEQLPG